MTPSLSAPLQPASFPERLLTALEVEPVGTTELAEARRGLIPRCHRDGCFPIQHLEYVIDLYDWI